jgi:peptidoglycan LD-endopeptidase LytH
VAELEELIAFRVRESFKHGSSVDPLAVFLASDDAAGALSRVEIVTRVVGGDRARTEELVAARALVDAAEQRLAEQAAELETARSRQAEVAAQLQDDFDAATALEASLSEEAREERARLERERLERERREREERERREREEQQRREREAARQAEAEREAAAEAERQAATEAERQAAAEAERDAAASSSSSSSGSSSSSSSRTTSSSRSGSSSGSSSSGSSSSTSGSSSSSSGSSSSSSGSGSSSTSTSSALACPLDQPRHFTDTWGAPRSGGRTHRGTDIMGPHGIPVRAIVGGTWRIMPYGASAGYWGILHGDDGNHYWYLHLQSHTVSNGARVSAGQQIARNGATGNAPPNTPHIHFELHPGGGSAVNPYATLRRACG